MNPEDYLASLLTTPEQEAKNLRASRSKQRVLAFADALRHIGNIYNTTQGAPAQQFNDPVTAERTNYKQDKLLRDANNLKYYTYQQAKAAQDAKQKQWELDYGLKLGNAAWQREYQQKLYDEKVRANDLTDQSRQRDLAARVERWNRQDAETARSHRVQESQRARDLSLKSLRTNHYINGGGSGRSSNPYVYPTQSGFITLGRAINPVGQYALVDKLRERGYLSESDSSALNGYWTTQDQKSAILNRAIGDWLKGDPTAAGYMKKHFGATDVGDSYNLGLDDDEDDDMDLGLD